MGTKEGSLSAATCRTCLATALVILWAVGCELNGHYEGDNVTLDIGNTGGLTGTSVVVTD